MGKTSVNSKDLKVKREMDIEIFNEFLYNGWSTSDNRALMQEEALTF